MIKDGAREEKLWRDSSLTLLDSWKKSLEYAMS